MIEKLFISYPSKGGEEPFELVHIIYRSPRFQSFIGYATVTVYSDKNYGVISNMMVNEGDRQMGAGKKILQACEETILDSFHRNECFLWCEKGSIEEEWYKREGYVYHSEYESNNLNSWYSKTLIDEQ